MDETAAKNFVGEKALPIPEKNWKKRVRGGGGVACPLPWPSEG